jgi:hypothetical protein
MLVWPRILAYRARIVDGNSVGGENSIGMGCAARPRFIL